MPKAIWKFPLNKNYPSILKAIIVPMPEGAQIVSCQLQGDMPTVWAIVDTTAEEEPVVFSIYLTGEPIPNEPGTFLGTLQNQSGNVSHVFKH